MDNERFVVRENVKRLRALLQAERDAAERTALRRLLDEFEVELSKLEGKIRIT